MDDKFKAKTELNKDPSLMQDDSTPVSSYKVEENAPDTDMLQQNLAYIRAQSLSPELEERATQIAESGIGTVNINYNANEPQIMVDTVFNKTYNASDLVIEDGKVIPVDWNIPTSQFNGDYMDTYIQHVVFNEINNNPATKVESGSYYANPTTMAEELKDSIGVTTQVIGSNDFFNGEELHYEDLSGATSVIPKEEELFNMMQDNSDIGIPYSHISQETTIHVLGENETSSHVVYENPKYMADETLEQAALTNDVVTDSSDKTISSLEFHGSSADLDPAKGNVIHAENPFIQVELAKNAEALAEVATIPVGEILDANAVPFSNLKPTDLFAPDGSTVDRPNATRTKDTYDTSAPEERKFDTNGVVRQNEEEISEAIKQKSVLRQFKGYSDEHYMQYFMSVGSASGRMVKGSVVQGDESVEIESASKIMRHAHDIFAYCDIAAGTTAKNLLIKREMRFDLMTVDVKGMLDSGQITFDDLSGGTEVADKLLDKGLRKSHVRKIMAAREQILENLKAQEVLYQFATETNNLSPEQLALVRNDSFYNDIAFSSELTSVYSTYFKNSENEMLKSLNPATMSRKDLLKFDKNVEKAEMLHQKVLGGYMASEKELAFIEAYRLKDRDRAVYDKMKREKLAHTNKKGIDKIAKMKGSAGRRFKFLSGRLSRSLERKLQDHAEGRMLRTIRTASGAIHTVNAIRKTAVPLAANVVKKGYKVTMFVTAPVRHLVHKYIIKPGIAVVKDFYATSKATIQTAVQKSEWYKERERKRADKANSVKGRQKAEQKKEKEAKSAERKKEKDAKNKDKRAKKEKKAAKKNSRKEKLGKVGKVLSAPMKILSFPFRSAEEIISWAVNKLKSLLIIPAFKILIIGVPILYVLAMLSRSSDATVANPFSTLYNDYIMAGNADDGVNYVYKWNELMEGWQADIEKDIRKISTHKPHTCNDRGILGEDTTCSICGAFILDMSDKDAEGLKNDEVYYDTKIYAYGSPKSHDDPTADWYHKSGANIDVDKLNGYRIYYLNGDGEVIASSTNNIKDILCLMAVWRENLFMSNDYYDPDVEPDPDKVNKTVKKTLEWMWDRFRPIVTTKVSSVYHTEYSTDTFPKNGDSYKCTDKSFYKKYNEAVGENVMMYDTVAPQQTKTPTVAGYYCSGKGCEYTEWWEWGSCICPLSEHTHGWFCDSSACSHVCDKDGACKEKCIHSHSSACCGKIAHSHSTSAGCYEKDWFREYYCPGHDALHCSYGYRDLNVYVTTFKLGDMIKLLADDDADIDKLAYVSFTNTLLNRKLGLLDSNPVKDFAGFPYTVFKDNSTGSRFTNRKEWKGDTYMYFSVPANFSRDDVAFNDTLKTYRRTINLKDAYDKGYISRNWFYESIANLTQDAIDAEFDGFNLFDYERHKTMTDTYGLESNMGFKICPNAEFHSKERQEGGGISETGCTGTIEWLYRLYSADWMQAYGVDSYGITSIEGNGSLSSDEVNEFMTQLDTLYAESEGISYQRKQLVQKVLNSVGKIPYWAGGTPSTKYYSSRWGRTAVPSDVNYEQNIAAGRTSFGLDAMGYFRYIYWSTKNIKPSLSPKAFYETSGITEVSYTNLKPGDIGFINPPSAEFNVIGIFVGQKAGVAQWVYMDKAAGTVVLTNGGSVSSDGTQGSFGYFYKFMD